MKSVTLLGTLITGAFLGLEARADDFDGSENRRHEPVIYSPAQTNPLDPYPKELFTNVIRSDESAYTICNGSNCAFIRNFGHDENIQRQYINFIIDQRRAAQ